MINRQFCGFFLDIWYRYHLHLVVDLGCSFLDSMIIISAKCFMNTVCVQLRPCHIHSRCLNLAVLLQMAYGRCRTTLKTVTFAEVNMRAYLFSMVLCSTLANSAHIPGIISSIITMIITSQSNLLMSDANSTQITSPLVIVMVRQLVMREKISGLSRRESNHIAIVNCMVPIS